MRRRETIACGEIAPSDEIVNRVLENVTVQGLEVRWDATFENRPLLENITARNLVLKNTNLSRAVIRNVSIDGMKCDTHSGFFTYDEFHQVALRGRISDIVFLAGAQFPDWKQFLREAEDAATDWSLDLTEAEGPIAVRGYAGHRLRLDPERQCYVPKEILSGDDWNDRMVGDSVWENEASAARRRGDDLILLSWGVGADRERQLRVVRDLRQRGLGR